MTTATKNTIASSAVWLLASLGYFAFYYDELLDVFSPLLGGALLLASLPLAVTAAVIGIRGKPRMMLGVSVTVVTVTIVGWLTPVGKSCGAHFKFWREKASYESIISELANGADSGAFDYPISVDPGPPQRVAFSWGGILDNWVGVVHDPTGEIIKANLLDVETWSNRDDPDYASVAGLFGGTLVRAQHLEGNWYLCWFT